MLAQIGVVVAVTHRFNQPRLVLGRELEGCGPGAEGKRPRVLLYARAHLLQRSDGLRRRSRSRCRQRAVRRRRQPGCRGPRAGGVAQREDPVQPSQFEGAIVADAKLSGVAHRVHRHHGREARRVGNADRVLAGTRVRRSHRSDLTVGPRLLGKSISAGPPHRAHRRESDATCLPIGIGLEHPGARRRSRAERNIGSRRLRSCPCCRRSARQSSGSDR